MPARRDDRLAPVSSRSPIRVTSRPASGAVRAIATGIADNCSPTTAVWNSRAVR